MYEYTTYLFFTLLYSNHHKNKKIENTICEQL